jgi:hypothetical protein
MLYIVFMIRKITAACVSMYLFISLQSCLTKCDEVKSSSINWTRLSVQQGYPAPNERGFFFVPSMDSVMITPMMEIDFTLEQKRLANNNSTNRQTVAEPSDTEQCDEMETLELRRAVRFFVYTLKDFNSEYPVNSDITSLCSEIHLDSLIKREIMAPLNPKLDGEEDMSRILKRIVIADSLTTEPIHQFRISVLFSDSNIVSAETKPVRRQ